MRSDENSLFEGAVNTGPAVIRGSFSDFDEFAEAAAAWEIDFRQVRAGALQADLLQVIHPEVSLAWSRISRFCWQQGLAHPGMRTFAVLHPDAPETVFCGEPFGGGNIALFGTDQFECMSPPGFDVITISITQQSLDLLVEATGLEIDNEKLGPQPAIMKADPRQIQRLRSLALNAIRAAASLSAKRASSFATAHLLSDIPELLLETITPARVSEGKHRSEQRHLLFRRARDYIHDHEDEPVKVLDIASELGVTRRTLELIFQDMLNITPKEYISTHRIYSLRRHLRNRMRDEKISDIANHLGYWHMGQLARDYRLRFGELPSQTLVSTST